MTVKLDHPKLNGETTVQNAITEVAAMVGENVKLRRGFTVSTLSPGVVSCYLHTSPCPGTLFHGITFMIAICNCQICK